MRLSSMKSLRVMVLAASTLAVASVGMNSSAFAQTPEARISWSQLTTQLEKNGYQIREIDQKYDGWKVEVTDKDNRRLELRVDKQGKVVHEKVDH